MTVILPAAPGSVAMCIDKFSRDEEKPEALVLILPVIGWRDVGDEDEPDWVPMFPGDVLVGEYALQMIDGRYLVSPYTYPLSEADARDHFVERIKEHAADFKKRAAERAKKKETK